MYTGSMKISGLGLLVLVAIMGLVTATAAQDITPLSAEEQDGFLQWLHSLEQEVAARQEKGLVEIHPLFPFEHDLVTVDSVTPYRHLTIAKALGVLEQQFQDPRQAENLSALVALANGRNYVNLTEYDSALVWFDVAAAKDTVGDFQGELRRESLAAAIAAEDSLRLAQRITEMTTPGADLTVPGEFTLALRWCLVNGDEGQLGDMADTLWAVRDSLPQQQVYWLARALHQLKRTDQLYSQLRVLILNGGLSLGLTETQRAWVLTTIADVSYLLGQDKQARKLFSTLLESPLPDLQLWATYQLAGLDLVAGDYLAAETGYGTVCRAKALGSWQARACAMEKATEEMARIRREGEPYGISHFYKP